MNMTFEARFENWRHWCLMNGRFQAKAGSAEGNYRSPQVWDDTNPKPVWLIEMDIPDAVEVNRAYCELSGWDRRVIKVLWFRPHWRPQWQGQKLGVHYTKLEAVGLESLSAMREMLDRRETVVRMTQVSMATAIKRPVGAIFA